jgi:hypothetical protein
MDYCFYNNLYSLFHELIIKDEFENGWVCKLRKQNSIFIIIALKPRMIISTCINCLYFQNQQAKNGIHAVSSYLNKNK